MWHLMFEVAICDLKDTNHSELELHTQPRIAPLSFNKFEADPLAYVVHDFAVSTFCEQTSLVNKAWVAN